MRCVDVNVIVSALRVDAPHHARALAWLEAAQRESEPTVILAEVAASSVRILTDRRIWAQPSGAADVVDALADLAAAPPIRLVDAPSGRWDRFTHLVVSMGLSGSDVPDALLAAAAQELGAVLVTFDRGFARFKEIAVELL